jgi:hypothetical protein
MSEGDTLAVAIVYKAIHKLGAAIAREVPLVERR